MSDEHSPEYYKKKFIPLIYLVGGILIAGTIITFAADKMGIAEKWGFVNAIIFAMSVAVVKASAVIYIFMHLKWDIKLKTIYVNSSFNHHIQSSITYINIFECQA